jgi:hypothetical protein
MRGGRDMETHRPFSNVWQLSVCIPVRYKKITSDDGRIHAVAIATGTRKPRSVEKSTYPKSLGRIKKNSIRLSLFLL